MAYCSHGLKAISVPEGNEVGAAASEVPTGDESADPPLPPPPQLARHETIIEESINLSNFINFPDKYLVVKYNDKSISLCIYALILFKTYLL